MLATTKVEDFDRFLMNFSTKGADKRKHHGSKGSTVFCDPIEDERGWVIFDWDEEGFKNLLSGPKVPAIIQEAGTRVRPSRRGSAASTTPSTSPWRVTGSRVG